MKNEIHPLLKEAAARGLIRDGMGAMVEDVRPLIDIIIEPGAKFAPLEGLTSEQVQAVFALCEGTPTHWVGEGGQGMTTIGSRLNQIREASSDLSLPKMDWSPDMLIFGETSTGMTSSPSTRPTKRRGRKSRKHRT